MAIIQGAGRPLGIALAACAMSVVLDVVARGCYAAENARPLSAESIADPYCGPRCAQYILRYYGKNVDLVDLIREMQWPHTDSGSTLAALDAALRKRGIHTFGTELPAGSVLEWSYPSIVHQRGAHSSLGHTVVWLPSSTIRRADYWDGLKGPKSLASKRFFAQSSGAVLLTAACRITDPERAARSSREAVETYWLLGGGLLLIACGFLRPWRVPKSSRIEGRQI